MRSPDDHQEVLKFQPSQASWALVRFVADPPSILARAFVIAIAATLPVGVVVASLVQVSTGPLARGMVVNRTSPLRISIPSSSIVEKVLVKSDENVAVDQPLFKLTSLESSRAPASEQVFRAPFPGKVHEVSLVERAPVNAGEIALVLVPIHNTLEVEAEIDGEVLEQIQEKMEATITLASTNSGPRFLMGHVRQIREQFADMRESSAPRYRVRIEFRDDPGALRPGRAADIRFGTHKISFLKFITSRLMQWDVAAL